MIEMFANNEVFALRDGEICQLTETWPESGRSLAVMLREVYFPLGEYLEENHEGKKIHQLAVLACQQVKGKWQWVQLSPATKESIGNLMIDSGAMFDHWYHLIITDPQTINSDILVVNLKKT